MISRIRSKASARSFSKSLKLDRGDSRRPESPGTEWSSRKSSMEADLERFTALDRGWDAQRSSPPPMSASSMETSGSTRSMASPALSLRADESIHPGSSPLHLQQSEDYSSSSSQDALCTPYNAYDTLDTLDDGVLEAKAIHSPMIRRPTDVQSSRMVGSSSVDSQQDYFKVHWAKAGPVPPARRAVRAKISTTAMSPSPSSASVLTSGSRRAQKHGDISVVEPTDLVGASRSVVTEAADPFQDSHEVTQNSSRVSTGTITQIAPSTFDTAGIRANVFSLTSSTDFFTATARVEEAETSDTCHAPITAEIPPGVYAGKERLKALLTEYNARVQNATEAICLSATSPRAERDEVLSPLHSPSRHALPRPLRRLGLDETPLEQRAHLLEGLLQHLIHVHLYEEIAEVFCYGCGTKADDAAKALMMYLQSSIPFPSLLAYSSRTHSLLSATLSKEATQHHASETLTRLHTHMAALFVWVGAAVRRSDAASHTMKGHGALKTARDGLVALCAALREQEEGWVELTMEPQGAERARPQLGGEELPTAPPAIGDISSHVASPTDERTRRAPILLVQALGLTFLPCPATATATATGAGAGAEGGDAGEEKTYRQLLLAEEGAEGPSLETLLEAQGTWV